MSLDRSAIYIAARSYTEYSNGLALFKKGDVSILKQTGDVSAYLTISGSVKEANSCFYTLISVSKDSFIPGSCSCHNTSRGLCAHQVATAICWLEAYLKNTENGSVETDYSVKLMINEYKNMLEDMTDELISEDELIHLKPELILFSDHLSFGLLAGTKKLLSVKSLFSFYNAYKNGQTVTLGRNDIYYIREKNIAQGDKELFDFVIKKCEQYFSRGLLSVETSKSIKLSETECDELFHICAKRQITVNINNTKSDSEVLDENPRISFLVSPFKDNAAIIKPAMDYKVYSGIKKIYIFINNYFYICSDDYSERCSCFLKNQYEAVYNGKGYSCLSSASIKEFCNLVIPYVDSYIDFVEDGFSLEQLAPLKLEPSFYFDMPEDTILSCEIKFKYGDYVFNPLSSEISEISRNSFKEKSVVSYVRRSFPFKDTQNKSYIQTNQDCIYQLLESGLEAFTELGNVYISDTIKSVHINRKPNISVGVSISGDLLKLKIDADGLSDDELRELLSEYKAKKKYYRLKNGDYYKLTELGDNNGFEAIDDLIEGLRIKSKSISDGIELSKNRAFYIDSLLNHCGAVSLKGDDGYKELIGLTEQKEKSYKLPEGLNTSLREYQYIGYSWMHSLLDYGFGGILADEMGLGKTLQVITLILSTRAEGRCSLVCCPASLVYNWYNEFKRFAPALKCAILQGEQSEREIIIREYNGYDVLITSYDILRRDIDLYENCKFYIQIIDEAQFIKNQNAQKSHAVKDISSVSRFALTGTPIENRLSELWSIFDYLMPGYLYSYQMFKAVIETPIVKEEDKKALDRLHKLIAPFILRRRKRDVLQDLPEKNEEIVYSCLEGEQKRLYAAVAKNITTLVDNSDMDTNGTDKIRILAELTRLRQICCDPSLIYEDYDKGSVKLNTCMELVEEGIEGNHKILIFSQFTSMLKIIKAELEKRGISYHMLTGETPAEDRIKLVDAFQKDDTSVFLISLKAGGTGLNLTAADIVIHYDPWWNVAAQNQATDRSHRIGQTKNVSVYKIITKDTIEDRIMALQDAKERLAEDILGGEHVSISSMTKKDILELLK